MKSRRVVILALPDCQVLDAVGPFEVFAGATKLLAARGARDPGYAPVLVTDGAAGPVTCSSGVGLTASASLAAAARDFDTLIVAGGEGARRAAEDPALVKKVARAARGARRVASVCTGAFVLAATGLLDRRRATTHWAYCDQMAARFPRVRVERDPIFVRDGRLWTSAGVTAGIDLALALVEEDLGREVALEVARWLVVFVRRAGGQSQFSAQLSAQAAERPTLRELQAFIVEHPEAALDVPSLARRAGMSVRHFSRTFAAEVGAPPALYVERVRVETARRLLEESGRSVDEVAVASGFQNAAALRRALGRRVGLSPREYRARFGAPRRETESGGPS